MTGTASFGVLGPVEVQAPGGPAVALPPSVRALLARLVLSPGRVVSVDALTDALWGEDLPADAANALQTRVSKLRRALVAAGIGDRDEGVVLTRAPGYQLSVPPEAVDAHRFDRLVTRARTAGAGGDGDRALAMLDEALALWRGPALADVGDAQWAQAEAARLEELRVGALEDRLELLLQAGRHGEAVADLERLVTLHPLRERLHRLLMLALYRGGRQADALTLYHGLRARLADELGIDPAPELQALAEAVLRQQVPAVERAPAGAPAPPSAPSAPVAPSVPVAPAPALPRRLTEVVGRERDVDAVLERLAGGRLVTLTGPGGVGKTTLSFEVARRAGEALADVVDEVRLVRLASLGRDADVAEGVARELGLVPSGPGEAAVSAVLGFLEPRRALLVVDNCEHVVDAAAELVERVLTASPHVRVLATSREALALPGEVQVAVHPLGEQPAVQLFAQRAAAVRPGFTLDGGTGPAVALVCRQLDGVPLAIELAAARVKALPLEEIAARLEDRFSLLTSGPRTGEARHRTLRATLDWSYELLTADEQALLRRLAVFRGGFSLDAAEQVCAFGGIRSGQVLDLLFRLVDRSLVVPDPATGRFRLLVTIRDYGHARLQEAGEADQIRQRHLLHFTAFAHEHGSLTCSGGPGWARMSEEHANLQAALEFALARARHTRAPQDVDAGLRLATAMVWFWQYGVRYEGVTALTGLLDLPGGSPAYRALALQGLGLLHIYYPNPLSRRAARESLAMFEQLGDARSAAISRVVIAWEGQYAGDAAEARRLLEQAEPVLADGAPPGMLALLHYVRASLDLREGAFETSITEWHRAQGQLRAAQDWILESAVLSHRGIALRAVGRHDEALDDLRQGVHLVRNGETPHGLAFGLVHQAHTLLDTGERQEAAALLEQAEDAARRAQNPRCQAWAAWGRARLALDAGDPATALGESRRAVDLLEDREFPWALADLHAFVARAAGAAQDGATASRDAVLANRTTPGTSRIR